MNSRGGGWGLSVVNIRDGTRGYKGKGIRVSGENACISLRKKNNNKKMMMLYLLESSLKEGKRYKQI